MDFKSLFPLKGEITQEIIDKANIHDCEKCIGVLTLRAALGPNANKLNLNGQWGDRNGLNSLKSEIEKGMNITTMEGVQMTRVQTPQTVTFILC